MDSNKTEVHQKDVLSKYICDECSGHGLQACVLETVGVPISCPQSDSCGGGAEWKLFVESDNI